MVLIEQVTEDLDDDRHLRNLDVLLQDIDDVSAGSQPEVVAPPKKTIRPLMIAIPAVVAIVLGILAFIGTFSKSSNPGAAALSNWHGNWTHQMQAAGDATVTGILAFDTGDDDETVGRSHSVFPDGSETNITLSGIVFSGNGNVMEGSWRTDNVQSLHGRFRFDLEGKERFDGYYTVDNQEGKYYWRGTK
jgi:hypothetical protein